MNETIRDFFVEWIPGQIRGARASINIYFWYSWLLALFVIVLAIATDQQWLATIVSYWSLVLLLVAVFAINGATWAVLLIFPSTREETLGVLKKVVMPLIFWHSVLIFALSLVPVEKISLSLFFQALVIVLVLASGMFLLNRSTKFSVGLVVFLAIIRLVYLVGQLFYQSQIIDEKEAILKDGILKAIIQNLIQPIQYFLVELPKDGFLGALFFLVIILLLLAIVYRFVKMQSEKTKAPGGLIFLLLIFCFVTYLSFPTTVEKVKQKMAEQATTSTGLFPDSVVRVTHEFTIPEPTESDYAPRAKSWCYKGYSLPVKAGETMISTNDRLWVHYEAASGEIWLTAFNQIPNGKFYFPENGHVYFTRKKGGGPFTTTIQVAKLN